MRYIRIVAILFLLCENALAQKPPELGYVHPPVIRAGATTDVRLGGYDFTPDMQFFVHDQRVKLKVTGPPGRFFIPEPPYWFGPKGSTTAFPIPREVPARITVPKNFPAGLVRWQAANANGASKTGVFRVAHGPSVLEKRDRANPQMLERIPIGVDGRIRKIAEVDRYVFKATKTGPVSLELFARRLGSNFNAAVQVRDQTGRKIVDVADTEGLDAAATFFAKAGERYTVSLHAVDFRGNRAFVYRLEITPGPRVLTTIPAAGPRGKTVDVEFVGYGLATGTSRLETATRKITFPADPRQSRLRYRLKTPFGDAHFFDIPLSDLPESKFAVAKTKQPISVPGAATGRLNATGRATFVFAAKKGDVFDIRAHSRAIGTRLDLSLRVEDATGKKIATNDDLPGTPDAGLTLRIKKDGQYACVLEDLSGRAGTPAAIFRLAISRPASSFALSSPQSLNVPLTGKATLTVKAVRSGGFQGEIDIAVRGLPPDMKAPARLKIPAKKNSVAIPIERADNAASHAAMIEITGTAEIAGKRITKPVVAAASGNLCPRDAALERTRGIVLATTMKLPFSVELVDKNRQRAVHRGTTYPAEFLIKRNPGFTGEVLLQMLARQSRHRQGIHGPVVSVPGNSDRALYPTFLPEWLETDRTTRMVVLGVGKVKDPRGRVRYLTKPADARITMILEGALLKVLHAARELTAAPGGSFTIPVRISRSAKLKGKVTVSLEVPKSLSGLVQCKAITIPADKNSATLTVTTAPGPKLNGRWRFVVKANASQNDRWPVVSQSTVSVEFSNTGNRSQQSR